MIDLFPMSIVAFDREVGVKNLPQVINGAVNGKYINWNISQKQIMKCKYIVHMSEPHFHYGNFFPFTEVCNKSFNALRWYC